MAKTIVPAHARKVYSGNIFSVFEWDQKLFDGSQTVFEAIRKRDSTDVIAMVGDKFIITEQEQPGTNPFIAFPGGRVEEHQTPLQNAHEELLQESGYASDDWKELGKWSIGHKIDYTVHVFIAKDCRKVSDVSLDAGEKVKVRLADFEEMVQLISDDRIRGSEIFKKILGNGLTPASREKLKEWTQ